METVYKFNTLEELINAGDDLQLEDISPDLTTLTIKIDGDQFDSSLTGEVAKALGAFQSALYRAAAEILHGTPSISALSAEEKAALEVVIQVSAGCSTLKIPGGKYTWKLANKAIEKMESKHIAIVACCAIAAFTAIPINGIWADKAKHNQSIEALSQANENMLKMAQTYVAPISAATEAAAVATAKAAKNANYVEFGSRRFDQDDIAKLNSRAARQEPQTDTLSVTCKILGFHKEGEILKVDLVEIPGGESYTVKVPPPGLFDEKLPERPTEVAELMEIGATVAVSIFVKESRSKTERMLASWHVLRNAQDAGEPKE